MLLILHKKGDRVISDSKNNQSLQVTNSDQESKSQLDKNSVQRRKLILAGGAATIGASVVPYDVVFAHRGF